jgi:UDP-galactopyranose mutase
MRSSDPAVAFALNAGGRPGPSAQLLCFSHLRWDFVFQRPQHLMTRLARFNRVTFWEEPSIAPGLAEPRLEVRNCPESGVRIAVPQLPEGLSQQEVTDALRNLLDGYLGAQPDPLIVWYYTPMMLPFSEHLTPTCTIYDCMDELANFRFAPPELLPLEDQLLARADLVFTGGYSLYEAKRDRHQAIHPFPSSVDREHFALARVGLADPGDQSALPRPRFGFYGVVDERMDLDLLRELADARPHWSIVMVGPVVKIDEAELPRRPNLHYLGGKTYAELPDYLSGWDVALMPFAMNEATRFISPTKTPEYLAAGRPVVSTPIGDVIRHYGEIEGVLIAGTAVEFIAACDEALRLARAGGDWLTEADLLLENSDWDETVARMWRLIQRSLHAAGRIEPVVSPTRWPAADEPRYDVMVVGAGFAGAVMAERLASQSDLKVLVVDKRPHIGGNAYDRADEAGLLIHQYGPHIFHTNSAEIFEYLSQFTGWRPYHHRVLANVDGMLVPIPINRTTINALYKLDLQTDAEVEAYLASRAEPVPMIRTSEDVVVSAVGRDLYEKFFRGYTRKQWGLDPSELDKSVTARVPTRTNTDDRYFADRFQAMPADGYTKMFERMLDQPNIDLLLGVEYREVRDAYPHDHLVFSGPIDEYFDYRFGKLPYRSLRFEHETLECEWLQPVAVVNYPDESVPYTRITEYKHLTGQQSRRHTSITREYPSAEGDPYYPIPRAENQALYKRYEALAKAEPGTSFVGRLATYRYYNMDQIVGQALATYRKSFVETRPGITAPEPSAPPLAVTSAAA